MEFDFIYKHLLAARVYFRNIDLSKNKPKEIYNINKTVLKWLLTGISRLLVISENYPELKSNVNFLALQDELAETENRISVERQRYNQAVGNYNTKIRKFPSVIIARLFNFDQREFFQAKPGSEEAPKVGF